jgi:hypothetical protein
MNSDQIAKLLEKVEGLEDLTDDCIAAIDLTFRANEDAVAAARQSGDLLIKLKQAVGHGNFIAYCDAVMEAHVSASWRARVMKLAKNWGEISAIWEHADDPTYTVDGLLKMWRVWQRGEKPKQARPKRPTLAEYQALEAALKDKDRRIKELEGELARLRSPRHKAA